MVAFEVQTPDRCALVDISDRVAAAVAGVRGEAVAVVFVPHTTAGVTINENADPSVRRDLDQALTRLAPRDAGYSHLEGNADAHVKASLVGSSACVPVKDGRLLLGTWQGVYLAEFDGPRRRRVTVVVVPAL